MSRLPAVGAILRQKSPQVDSRVSDLAGPVWRHESQSCRTAVVVTSERAAIVRRDSTAEARLAVLARSKLRAASIALTRRRLIVGAGALATSRLAMPGVSRAADRPRLTHGLQSGDVTCDSGVVWARADRPSRVMIDASTRESFATLIGTTCADALPESDFTVKVLLDELPAGQDIFYRVRCQDLAFPTITGAPEVGRFRTAPDDRRSVSFAWSGDVAGQGWGIDHDRGGMRAFATMLANRPDFFIHSGDSIYADGTIPPTLALPGGGTWRNLVTEEKSRVAATLADYRGNYKYNLLDDNLRAFNAAVPVFAQWDDHEVDNDWGPAEATRPDGARAGLLLRAARGNRAFHEFMPTRFAPAEPGRVYRRIAYGPLLDVFVLDMRSYRGVNAAAGRSPDCSATALLGARQLVWLERELARSAATWKVIAADLPIGLVSQDGIAMGDGAPCGREREIAGLLAFMKRRSIRNTIWITADVHYTAAHHYDPNRAAFQEFEAFWEFVSGPLHAGTWTPSALDDTFGPRVAFQKASATENLSPACGLQFFGHVTIDGASETMTVTLKDVNDTRLWSIDLNPRIGAS